MRLEDGGEDNSRTSLLSPARADLLLYTVSSADPMQAFLSTHLSVPDFSQLGIETCIRYIKRCIGEARLIPSDGKVF